MKPLYICPICLRTERKLKSIDSMLSKYYEELTNCSLKMVNPGYCSDCEYLLRKTYNFNQKCLNAAKILNRWMSIQRKNKTSPNMLHRKLPPISLDTWKPENTKVFTYMYSDTLDTTTLVEENISDKADTITIEDNTSNILDKDTTKGRVIENTIETISNTKLSGNTNFELNKIITPQYVINDTNTINSCNNVIVPSQLQTPYVVLLVDDIEKHKRNENDKVNNTMKSINDMPILNLTHNMVISSENIAYSPNGMLKLRNDIPRGIHHDISFGDRPKSTYDIPKLTNDISKNGSSNKSVIVNIPDNKDGEIICLDDDVIVIDDEIEYPDDASLNSGDDCDDYLYPPQKKTRPKGTLDELADIALSDEDFDGDDICLPKNSSTKNYFRMKKVISLEKTIASKLNTMNESLDSICQNWEITSLTNAGVPNVSNDKVIKFIRQYLTTAGEIDPGTSKHASKTVAGKLMNIRDDLDLINKKCVEVVDNYKNDVYEPRQRVRAELLKRYESLGQLRAADGSVLDKDIIMKSLDNVSDRLILRLLRYLERSEEIMPAASACLRTIIGKQKYVKYESGFDIEYMRTEKEMLEEFERRKSYKCYMEAKFKCEICYQGFEYAAHLYNHKKYHDESQGSSSCPVCHLRFEGLRRLTSHLKAHEAVYKCKLCPLVTYYSSSMRNHFEQHQGTKYECKHCGTTYKSRSVYLNHKTRRHSRPANACTICGSTFVSPRGLSYHLRWKHRDGKPSVPASGFTVKCEFCYLTFHSRGAYSKHQRIVHNNSFRPKRRKPNMTCRVCNKVGHSYGWMTMHFSMEHPTLDVSTFYTHERVFLCHVCGKGYRVKSDLARHIDYHDGVRFPCKTCGKSFALEKALLSHRQHTHGPRNLFCERCGKGFKSKSNLDVHVRTHIGDRRYKCDICGKGFLHRSAIKEHIKGFHNKIRRVRKRGDAKTSTPVGDTPDGVTVTSVKAGLRGAETGVREVETGVREVETEVYENDTGMYEDETGVHENVSGVNEVEAGVYEDETWLSQDETGVHEDETGLYEDETGLREVETDVYEDETWLCEDETGVHEVEAGMSEVDTGVHEDEMGLCEDERGGHGIAEIGAEVILDTETGEMTLVLQS